MRLKAPTFRLRTLALAIVVCAVAIQTSLYFFSPTRRLTRQLRPDQPAYLRREAAMGLGYQVPAWEVEQAISVLLDALDDPSPRVRESAAGGLVAHGLKAERAIPKLMVLFNDPDRGVRSSAFGAMGYIMGPASPEREAIVTALMARLENPDVEVQLASASTLIQLGELEAVAGPLASVMGQTEEMYRGRVRYIFARLGNRTSSLIPGLIAATRDPDELRRKGAIELLIQYGPVQSVRSAHQAASQNNDPEVRRWASNQIERLLPHP